MKKIKLLLFSLLICLNVKSHTKAMATSTVPCTFYSCIPFHNSDLQQVFSAFVTAAGMSYTDVPCTFSSCQSFHNSDYQQIYSAIVSNSFVAGNYIPYTGAIQSASLGLNNIYVNNYIARKSRIVSSNSVTVLTINSPRQQQMSGTTTHTFNLPDATTLDTNFTFEFNNNSTGVLTIANTSSTSIYTVPAGGYARVFNQNIDTPNDNWDCHYLMPANANFGTSGLVTPGSITSPTIYGSSAASGTLYLRGSSSATPGLVSIGSSTGSNFNVAGTTTLTGQTKQTNTLNLEGNTTWNTNQTNTLSTGNSGTVAVLSDAMFSLEFHSNPSASVPLDATTYYMGNNGVFWVPTSTNGVVTIPYNCTLVSWNFNNLVSGTFGTTETATVSIAGTTNYTLTSSVTLDGSIRNYTASGLSQNFSAGDVENIKIVTPTYATNPTNVYSGVTLWFVRRQ
jgi:hypothetical protein